MVMSLPGRRCCGGFPESRERNGQGGIKLLNHQQAPLRTWPYPPSRVAESAKTTALAESCVERDKTLLLSAGEETLIQRLMTPTPACNGKLGRYIFFDQDESGNIHTS